MFVKPGMQWMRGGAKRECDRALSSPVSIWKTAMKAVTKLSKFARGTAQLSHGAQSPRVGK